ncbi:MAG: hypothetical protein ACLVLH_06355 [Eisenbergiella massiliensis]
MSGASSSVGVARALVVNPRLFLRTSHRNLDSNIQERHGADAEGQEQKQTPVMVTHDNYLAGFADRIFHIIDGKIVKIEDNRNKAEEPAAQKA